MAYQLAPTKRTTTDRPPPKPVAVSTASGQTMTVHPPTTSTVPAGTVLRPPQPTLDPGRQTLQQAAQRALVPDAGGQVGGSTPTTLTQAAQRAMTTLQPQAPTPPATPAQPITTSSGLSAQPQVLGVSQGPGTSAPVISSPTPVPGLSGVATAPITGTETPQQILPTANPQVTGLNTALVQAAQQALQHPTAYTDDLFNRSLDTVNSGLDRSYNADINRLDSELAARGLDRSSVAGGMLGDYFTQRQAARDAQSTALLQDAAQALAAGRAGALNGALNTGSYLSALDANNRNELRGERSYLDSLDTQAHDQALADYLAGQNVDQSNNAQWQNLLQLGLGAGLPGLNAGTGAAALLQQAAGQYGQQAQLTDEQLGALAQLAARVFGGTT